MKVFVVNLDRDTERLAHMQALLGGMGIAYERIAAVDGRVLTAEVRAAASPELSPGEIGCLMSHRAAWERIAAGSERYALILEDDIFVAPILSMFADGDGWIPPDADVVKLETTRDHVHVDRNAGGTVGDRRLLRLRSTHPGSAAYVISAAAARDLLRRSAQLTRPVDAVLFELPDGEARGLIVYQVDPAVCIQNDFLPGRRDPQLASRISDERSAQRRVRKGLGYRIWREIRTPFQKLAQGIRQNARSGGDTDWRIIPELLG
jgi:glycosyl transferase family 25